MKLKSPKGNCRWSAKLEIFVVQTFMETLDDSCEGASAGCLPSFKTHYLRVFFKKNNINFNLSN